MAVRVDGDRLDCAQPAKRKTNEKKRAVAAAVGVGREQEEESFCY